TINPRSVATAIPGTTCANTSIAAASASKWALAAGVRATAGGSARHTAARKEVRRPPRSVRWSRSSVSVTSTVTCTEARGAVNAESVIARAVSRRRPVTGVRVEVRAGPRPAWESTSARRILPPGPEPCTRARSTPRSRARRRTGGIALGRSRAASSSLRPVYGSVGKERGRRRGRPVAGSTGPYPTRTCWRSGRAGGASAPPPPVGGVVLPRARLWCRALLEADQGRAHGEGLALLGVQGADAAGAGAGQLHERLGGLHLGERLVQRDLVAHGDVPAHDRRLGESFAEV